MAMEDVVVFPDPGRRAHQRIGLLLCPEAYFLNSGSCRIHSPVPSEHLRSASSFSISIFNGESQGIIEQSSPSLDASGSMLLSAAMLTGIEGVTFVKSRTASINDDEAAIRNEQSLLSSRR